jgi:DNA-cytosine methyltransferase
MSDDRTHASFFSGVGGLDMGLERAGWRTVSFSEIDPYASAVLAERWPGVPNLGSVIDIADRWESGQFGIPTGHQRPAGTPDDQQLVGWDATSRAVLWTGGFPCQDLSVAGKRRGMGAGTRSGLAYAFLDLVGRHHPRFVLLENVLGLLSSHGGRDMAALIGALVELGYGVGYRVLDARHFGVPQRRRRVFILGVSPGGRAGAERAAEVLSVGSRCRRHPPTGVEAGPGVAAGAQPGVDIARAITGTSGKRHDDDTDTLIANGLRASDGHHGYSSPRGDGGDNLISAPIRGNPYGDHISAESHLIGPSPDADRMRAADGLAGRSHDRDGVADTLREHPRPGSNSNGALVAFNPYRTLERDGSVTSGYAERDVVDALHGPTGNKEPLFVSGREKAGNAREAEEADVVNREPDLLPLGLDSHRYRCCGNGVVADVAEWIGLRLAAAA